MQPTIIEGTNWIWFYRRNMRNRSSRRQHRESIVGVSNGFVISADLVDTANKEVVLSAGAVDIPKLLLLSGICPSVETEQHDVPLIRNLPGVSKNLDDHLCLLTVSAQKPGRHHRTSHIKSPIALATARKQWNKDPSGPLTRAYLPQMMAFLKSPRVLACRAATFAILF